MAHNRRHQSAAVRFGPALKVLLLCLFVGGSGVGFVWQKNQLLRLSGRLGALERQLEARRLENQALNRLLAERLLPEAIEARVRELKLDLVPTSATNIVYIPDAPIEPLALAGETFEPRRFRGDRLTPGLAARH